MDSTPLTQLFSNCQTGMTKEYVSLHVEINNTIDLRAAFDALHLRGYEICAFIGEPVMGEGNTGATMTPEFYKEVRDLCNQYNSMMIIDSIQAGLRCSGELSVVNYPEFKDTGVYPDLEVFSKAINAGQFPVSVLALNPKSAYKFVEGTYGNTMTGNPRGLHVVNTVLSMMTKDVKKNIVKQGAKLVEKFEYLAQKYPMCIKNVSGHGLLIGVQLSERIDCIDMENMCRKNGLSERDYQERVSLINDPAAMLEYSVLVPERKREAQRRVFFESTLTPFKKVLRSLVE